MYITCKMCQTRLTISTPGSPIVRCGNCGYPNPVVVRPGPDLPDGKPMTPPAPAMPSAAVPPPSPIQRPTVQAHNGLPPLGGAARATGLPLQDNSLPRNEVGWLVVHDENAPSQTFPLREGRQVIGRKNTGLPCDLMIATQDPYMSRNHCVLEVKRGKSGGYDYLISDRKMTHGTPENMSSNGTYVNALAKPLQPNDVVYLNDGDTIQLGQTKAVIKTIMKVANADDASRLVQDSDYMPTVVVSR